MRLLEVVTPAPAREFLRFQVRLYADDANYVRPLDRDVTAVFDAAKGSSFVGCWWTPLAVRWAGWRLS